MAMKKFINDPANLTPELLEGFTQAFSSQVKLVSDKLVCRAEEKDPSKVAVVTLGGAGHEPALSGFVGFGGLDCSVVGDIFAAPGPPKVYEALKMYAERHVGVLFIVLNHAGDIMSSNMAMDMLENDGLADKVKILETHEDIAPGADTPTEDRRGLVGCVPVYKIAGAAAEAGKSLEEIYEIAARYNDKMATLAVAMKTATHPATGESTGELPEDEMEIGMGQHGEAGTGRSKILTADETAGRMLPALADAIQAKQGDKVLAMINGAGATTHMEMFIVFRAVKKLLAERGVEVAYAQIGEFLTVQEMAGFQMHLGLVDDEILELLNAPADTPYWVSR